jgi:hypothetical protein
MSEEDEPYAIVILRKYPKSTSTTTTIPKGIMETLGLDSGDRVNVYLDVRKRQIILQA